LACQKQVIQPLRAGISIPLQVAGMMHKKKIVIAEDQTLVREGLKSLVSTDERYVVVAEAKDGLEAVKSVKKHRPDLLLLDLAMPRMNGISAIREIKREYPETQILAITFHTSDEYILEAFQSGADGYCLKNDSHAELMTAIQRVLEGKKYLSPAISETVLEGYLEGRKTLKTETSWATLTQREREVLKLVGEGYTSKEIADMLAISSKTVDKHRSNIMNKLDLHSAAALSAYAVEKGIVTKS
jgi:DNA-binding NarL/FixJ family response regulator